MVGWAGNDMYAAYYPGYPAGLPQRTQDLEQARSLLKQAGQENLAVELVCSDGVGVDIKVRKVDSSTMYGDEYRKWPFAMDYWGTH